MDALSTFVYPILTGVTTSTLYDSLKAIFEGQSNLNSFEELEALAKYNKGKDFQEQFNRILEEDKNIKRLLEDLNNKSNQNLTQNNITQKNRNGDNNLTINL